MKYVPQIPMYEYKNPQDDIREGVTVAVKGYPNMQGVVMRTFYVEDDYGDPIEYPKYKKVKVEIKPGEEDAWRRHAWVTTWKKWPSDAVLDFDDVYPIE